MKTFYLKILHAGMNWFCKEIRADYFEVSDGAYIFYTRSKNPNDPDFEYNEMVCAYPIGLTIIESINTKENNVTI